MGILKANTDAALFEEEGAIGLNVVIRNNNGRFLAAKTVKYQGTMDARQAEVA